MEHITPEMPVTPESIDWDAARRRKFDGGHPVHDDPDAIIHTRIRWINNSPFAEPQHCCPRCTAYKFSFSETCRACEIGQ